MSYVENGWENTDSRSILEEERRARKHAQTTRALTLLTLGVGLIGFFGTSILTASLVYQLLLRRLRQRPAVIFLTAAIPGALLLWWYTGHWADPIPTLTQQVQALNLTGAWVTLNTHTITPGAGVGLITGWLFTVDAAIKFKTSKWMVESPSMWSYKFRFADTPWEKWRKHRIRSSILNGTHPHKSDETIIGVNDETGEPVTRTYDEANRHTFVSGASGTGKTVFITSMVRQDILNRVPCILVNFKPDRAFTEKTAGWATEAGEQFYHFAYGTDDEYLVRNNPGGHSYFDPLEGLGITEKVEMVLNMRAYDTASEVYKSAAHEILQVVLNALTVMNTQRATASRNNPLTLDEGETRKLASALDNLETLEYACENTPIWKALHDVRVAATTRGTNTSRGLTSLQTQLRTILSSEFGQWIGKPKHPGDKFIDLFTLTNGTNGAPVILFDLNSDSEKDFARYLGSMILGNITAVSARRRDTGVNNQVNVYVDEFQVLPPDAVRGLVEKARASRLAITLSQQSIQQVITSAERNGEAMLDALLDTVGNFVIFSGSSQDTAEKLSRIVGPHEVTKYRVTTRRHGFWFSINWDDIRKPLVSEDVVTEPIIYPSEFMNLDSPSAANGFRSVAIVVKRTPMEAGLKHHKGGALTRRVRVLPPPGVVEPVELAKTPVGVHKTNGDVPSAAYGAGTGHNPAADTGTQATPSDSNTMGETVSTAPASTSTAADDVVPHVSRAPFTRHKPASNPTHGKHTDTAEDLLGDAWPTNTRKKPAATVIPNDDTTDVRLNTALTSLQHEFTTPTQTTTTTTGRKPAKKPRAHTGSSLDMWNTTTDLYGNTRTRGSFSPEADTDL